MIDSWMYVIQPCNTWENGAAIIASDWKTSKWIYWCEELEIHSLEQLVHYKLRHIDGIILDMSKFSVLNSQLNFIWFEYETFLINKSILIFMNSFSEMIVRMWQSFKVSLGLLDYVSYHLSTGSLEIGSHFLWSHQFQC